MSRNSRHLAYSGARVRIGTGTIDRADFTRRLVLACAILASGGLLFIPRGPLTALMLLIGAIVYRFGVPRLDMGKLLIYGWIYAVMVLAFLREQEIDTTTNFIRLGSFVAGLMLLNIYSDTKFGSRLLDDLRAILLPLPYIAIVTVALSFVVPGAFMRIEIGAQTMYTFLGVFSYAASLVETSNLIRPIGFFWEPGVFAIYLNILLFVLFVQKTKLTHLGATVIAIVLTSSTVGILFAGAQGLYFILGNLRQRRKGVRDVLLIGATLLAAPAFYAVADQNIADKFFGAFQGSFTARNFDLNTGMEVISENPLTGIGFSTQAYFRYSGSGTADTSTLSEEDQAGRLSTNGVMVVLFSLGVPLGVIYLGGVFFQGLFPHRLLFGTMILVFLSSNALSFSPFFVFLLFSGMMLRRQRKRASGGTGRKAEGFVPRAATRSNRAL